MYASSGQLIKTPTKTIPKKRQMFFFSLKLVILAKGKHNLSLKTAPLQSKINLFKTMVYGLNTTTSESSL